MRGSSRADADLGAARDGDAGKRSGRRVRQPARRLAREHARDRAGLDAAHDPPLPRRPEVDRADRRGTRARGRHRLRQELAGVRQRRGEPVPRPLLPRLHARRRAGGRGRPGGAALERRRRDVVGGGDGSHSGDRRDPGRPAERGAHARLLVSAGLEHGRRALDRRRRDAGRAGDDRADQAKAARPFRAPPVPAADVDGAGRVVAVWQDCRFRSDCQANDIVFTPVAGRSDVVAARSCHAQPERGDADDRRGARHRPAWQSPTTHSGRTASTRSS